MFSVSCDNASKITVNFAPDGRLDGPIEFAVVSGDGDFEYDPDTAPLSMKAVSGSDVFDSTTSDTVGLTVIRATADVRKGPGRETITEDIVLTVTAVPEAEATTLGMSVGAIEKK
jgi:hypothetical protein